MSEPPKRMRCSRNALLYNESADQVVEGSNSLSQIDCANNDAHKNVMTMAPLPSVLPLPNFGNLSAENTFADSDRRFVASSLDSGRIINSTHQFSLPHQQNNNGFRRDSVPMNSPQYFHPRTPQSHSYTPRSSNRGRSGGEFGNRGGRGYSDNTSNRGYNNRFSTNGNQWRTPVSSNDCYRGRGNYSDRGRSGAHGRNFTKANMLEDPWMKFVEPLERPLVGLISRDSAGQTHSVLTARAAHIDDDDSGSLE